MPAHEYLGELAGKQLVYYPTVTREAFEHQGRITDLIESGKLFADLACQPIDPSRDRVMICGSTAMNKDLRQMLGVRGFVEGSTQTPGDFVVERAFVDS